MVAQKLTWVHDVVPGLNRSYLRISSLPPAPHYRVTVWAFDIIDTDTPAVPAAPLLMRAPAQG